MKTTNPDYIYTFAAELISEQGHFFEYHKLLNRAAKAIKIFPKTFLPVNSQLTNFPQNWEKKLFLTYHWRSKPLLARISPVLANIKNLFKLTQSFNQIIQEKVSSNKRFIFFFETFNTFYLIALVFALHLNFKKRKSISFCFLYRYEPRQLRYKGKKDKRLLNKIRKLTKNPVRLFTDTDLLAKRLKKHLKHDFTVLPPMSTKDLNFKEGLHRNKNDSISFWWPGGARKAKGLEAIQNLAYNSQKSKKKILLKSVFDFDLSLLKPHIEIEILEDKLSRGDYVKHFLLSDFILLPYDEYVYRSSSSGIFFEAILSAIFPLVTPNTWMAHELEKYSLDKLILDFKNPDIFEHCNNILEDKELFVKLQNMRKSYLNKNSFEVFKNTLKKALFTA